ncbi:MAG: hypothetical protein FVQ77_12410 [Cytophagales bacterium]|nr:hypothetical protein [Cytophagales bacterium]
MKRYILSGLIGFGICICCLLPPILHFITGPLGPFIGGLVAGTRIHANKKGAIVIGLIIGLNLTLLFILIFNIISGTGLSLPFNLGRDAQFGRLFSHESIDVSYLSKIAAGVFLYGSLWGILGAYLGGRIGK